MRKPKTLLERIWGFGYPITLEIYIKGYLYQMGKVCNYAYAEVIIINLEP